MEFYTTVDDDLYGELCSLTGEKVVYFEIWEESLADELEVSQEQPETKCTFDVDLYLEDGIYFQLYGATFFPSLESDPWQGEEFVRKALSDLIRQGIKLNEIAVDEEDGLILVFSPPDGEKNRTRLYCSVGGWLLEEWDELPE